MAIDVQTQGSTTQTIVWICAMIAAVAILAYFAS